MNTVKAKTAMGWICAALLLATAPALRADTPPHYLWASSVATNVAHENNDYATNPGYIYWPGVGGQTDYKNRTQCSPFITLVLKQAYGWTDKDFRTWLGSSSPSAARYHDAIVAGTGFTNLPTVDSIHEGDIIAIKYLDGTLSATGHIMIAAGPVTPRAATAPLIDGTTQYEVPVIDSSNSGHGEGDTRRLPDGSWDDGAGQGTFRLYVDASGQVVGHTWSTYGNSVFYDQTARHLVIGRLAY